MPRLSTLWKEQYESSYREGMGSVAMKSIDTEWHGKRFRSRLEARWAVLFEALCIEWEYEPEGFEFDDGTRYLPDFLLHGIVGRGGPDLYVEVKGKMTFDDADKVRKFSSNRPVYLVGDMCCQSVVDMGATHRWFDGMESVCYDWPYYYNYLTVDDDNFGAFLGVDADGAPRLFGDDSSYLSEARNIPTALAYAAASTCRFEYGERPETSLLYQAAREIVIGLRRSGSGKGD